MTQIDAVAVADVVVVVVADEHRTDDVVADAVAVADIFVVVVAEAFCRRACCLQHYSSLRQ